MADQRGGGIAWTDETWNPIRGCSRVSEGCRHCYAERIAARFCGRGRTFEGFAKVIAPRDLLDRVGGRRDGWTGRVELIDSKLDEPLHWRRPRRIFVNSMSDLFHEALSDEAVAAVFGVMAAAPQHTFQVLTKRPERMCAWFKRWSALDRAGLASPPAECMAWAETVMERPLPTTRGIGQAPRYQVPAWPLPNVWLGVSVEDQRTADERIPLLLVTPAAVRWVSYEPALRPVDFSAFLPGHCSSCGARARDNVCGPCEWVTTSPGLEWIVAGGESGRRARPAELDWFRSARAQVATAGAAFFMKQLGSVWAGAQWAISAKKCWDRAGGDPAEWPPDLRVREFPEVRA